MNLLPIAQKWANYLRLTSVSASATYQQANHINSKEFGTTKYQQEIALLHIDGNHDYSAVKADIECCGSLVCKRGGWIVFDDYVWAFGNGPKRAADEFLEQQARVISCAFVMGTAMFIQIGGEDS